MSTKRIRHTAKFKFQIAVEAIKSDKTINQLASEHQLHPSQISQWKKQLLEQGSDIFATTPPKNQTCLLYTSPSPRDRTRSRMPSSA